MHDLIIIGGGPAAMAAASYALDKQLDTLMIYDDLGGKIGRSESRIGNDAYQRQHQSDRTRRFLHEMQVGAAPARQYLPANDTIRLLIQRLMQSGCVLHDRVLSVAAGLSFFSVEMATQGVLQASAVIVATGATPRLLEAPGARKLIDPSMSYSITTYAAQTAGQRVAVIGSTPRAIMGAAELAQHADQVALILPNAAALSTRLGAAVRSQPNIEILAGYEVLEVIGQQHIEALALRRAQQTRWLSVQRAFVDLGLQPNSEIVRKLVVTDHDGFIVVDQSNATSAPGLFAAGDVTAAPGEYVLIAIGDGARAAMSAYEYCLARRLSQVQTS
jgi:thioredoxin reductase